MSKIIVCSKCGREKKEHARGLCRSCYDTLSRTEGICLRCHNVRLLDKKGLCNSCHVAEYKKKYHYKGRVGICIFCNQEKVIHAQQRCSSCYHLWYREKNLEKIRESDRKRRLKNPEKVSQWQKNYYIANRDKEIQRSKEYREKNKEKLQQRDKEKYVKYRKEQLERSIDEYKSEGINEEINNYNKKMEYLKLQIPDLKRVWVNEFLNTAYKNKSEKTKLRFLMDIIRLLNFLQDVSFEKYYGGWNIVEATDIEDCQVNTGILKDSLRIFFKWLLNRKNTTYDLSDAIPTQTKNIRVSKVTGNLIKSLYNKWNYTECELQERIAGLLIMYYGLTNSELRYLKNDDFKNGKMKIRDQHIELECKLNNLINEYFDFKQKRFFGVNTTYFFTTAYSIPKDAPVGVGHFSKLFKSRNIGVSPSDLRKAMIYFHKNSNEADPFYIASLFGISPRGAARYFER